ncbi:hypothetical protein PQC38_gp079 [Aeromonas phage BUCT695]|uniref:hypothetical protein n=1 Tax=Aeromonas phage BUCT695 TaxID=2908630 RepID=UPI0023293A0E|nr:hypothetical protein PQC38_gp079 [Aeromonas phage BUCT695]UIW10555.1 hypothetical protein [Aeromonas phage BUCT695]
MSNHYDDYYPTPHEMELARQKEKKRLNGIAISRVVKLTGKTPKQAEKAIKEFKAMLSAANMWSEM